ncbi:uncharacterized protein TRIVIDRAFT_61480 [Trichoderma virens Gv29-8]|uniref:Uncharacterized protein n=1 Tax=Hypocrea virens (strain Gv29-8 / FGSC 10586) TaxID=413071 RepID=G9MMY6_HYPVG|nr:uncharacterized protein TRIVIDRAFT_61480 [Trichoderma virens Gv29-8]EHK24704.1 hypothetical protein TRIVIDRAFT_61480 [Trichoderma virens Gv29-8]
MITIRPNKMDPMRLLYATHYIVYEEMAPQAWNGQPVSLTAGFSLFPFPLPFTDETLGTCFEPDVLVAHHDGGTSFCIFFHYDLAYTSLTAATNITTATHRRHVHVPQPGESSCWILDAGTGPRRHLGQKQKQSDDELRACVMTKTTKTSVVAPQHGRLDRQSVQSRKSRYLVEDGVWRGLTARFGSRGCTPPTFMRTPSCKSQDTAQTWILCLVKCRRALCWAGPQAARISERQRGSDGGGAKAVVVANLGARTCNNSGLSKRGRELVVSGSSHAPNALEPLKYPSMESGTMLCPDEAAIRQYPAQWLAVGGRCSLSAGHGLAHRPQREHQGGGMCRFH